MKNVHLGLDLGIASIGWSLVDNEQNIVACGSHLFKQLSDPKSGKYGEKERGDFRRARRTLNRKKQRKIDFLNMIDINSFGNQFKMQVTKKPSSFYKEKYQKIFGFSKEESSTDFLFRQAHKYDIYRIYEKGFKEELNPKELFLFLYYKLSFRGVFFKSIDQEKVENYSYEKSVFKNILIDNYFKKNHKFRNKSNADNSFSIFWNWKDIEFILKKCSYIDEEFIDDYKNIFLRQRKFNLGPGSFKSPSKKWGVDYDNQGNPIGNIWDKKIGNCPVSVYQNQNTGNKIEKRMNQYFFISELANLIKQLVYTKLNNNYLRFEQIIKIINKSIFDNKPVTSKNICKWLEINENDLTNYPLDKNRTDSNFIDIKKIRTYLDPKKGFIKNIKNKNIEKLYEVLIHIDEKRFELILDYYVKDDSKDKDKKTQNKDFDGSKIKAQKMLSQIKFEFEIDYDAFVNFATISESDLSGTTEYGKSAYNEYINKFFNGNFENNKIPSIDVYFKEAKKYYVKSLYKFEDDKKYLPLKMFDKQDFLSPNVKNSLIEAMRIINNVLRRYVYKNNYFLESIMLETTWNSNDVKSSFNSKNRQSEIIKYQNYQEKLKKEAQEELKKYNQSTHNTNIKKYILWKMQDGKDFYSFPTKQLTLDTIENWQIDHIIPFSISYNNHLENLVVTNTHNSEKGNKTPYQYLGEKFYKLKSIWKDILKPQDNKENKIPNNEKIIRNTKFDLLTTEKVEEKINSFINANLAETTYAISKLKEGLVLFFENLKDNKKELNLIKNCDVRTISGYHSQSFRESIDEKWEKDRDISNHHAHDASIVALYSSFPYVNDWYKWARNQKLKLYYLDKQQDNNISNFKTINLENVNNIFKDKSKDFRSKIENAQFYYSFKPYKMFNSSFYKYSLEEQFEKIKERKSKTIFSNQLFVGYKEIEDEKHEVKYLKFSDELTTTKEGKINHSNIFKLFLELNNLLSQNEFLKLEEKRLIIKNFCNENYIQTDYLTIEKIYYQLKSLDIFNKHEKGNPFEQANESLISGQSNILIGMIDKASNYKISHEDEDYINKLMKNYFIIIDKDNKTFTKISKIKILDNQKYFPTFELKNKKYSNLGLSNKFIFDKKYQEKLSWNQTILGDEHKSLVLLKNLDDKKQKINFYKINQLNKIARAPKNFEVIQYIPINANSFILLENEIWKFSSLDISSNQIKFSCISNKKKKDKKDIRKPYLNGDWKENQELLDKLTRKFWTK